MCQTGAESVGIRGTRYDRGAARALTIGAAAIGAALSAPASAADMAGTANAAVVRPNTLIKTDDLDFGTLVSGATGGTATINPVTNARTTRGGVTPGGNEAPPPRVGAGAARSPPSLVRAASTSGGGIALLGVTLLPSGVQTYYIGGTLNVPANQPEGNYSGTFTLTVNYL